MNTWGTVDHKRQPDLEIAPEAVTVGKHWTVKANGIEVHPLTPLAMPMLNAGCGRIILPDTRPAHHGLIDEAIYAYPHWVNVDRNMQPGVDRVVDLFTYPFPFEDNEFSGVLLTHICEHIPHEIKVHKSQGSKETREYWEKSLDILLPTMKRDDPLRPTLFSQMGEGAISPRAEQLLNAQDGWYAFFMEIYRVCEHGAIVHILSPYGWSQGAITDPTHTRYLTEHTFTHSMQPDPNSPFEYQTGGINFELVEDARFALTQLFSHLAIHPTDSERVREKKERKRRRALQTRLNVVYELAIKLRVVKE